MQLGAEGSAPPGESRPSTLYLDTSALVKLYVAENGSESVAAATAAASLLATCVVTYAEMRAAFMRATREGRIDASRHTAAVGLLNAHWPRLVRLVADEACSQDAGRLIETHARRALRGFDAIHLASAHRLAAGKPASITFACWDVRLWRAARDDGFAMVPEHEPA